ncbi:RNA polymerase sigma factor [Chitinophaga nivalis]|uniref:Sigma-70 family RNA polymerase sigma factor n=1 Tax=Chitinophaga nivalis TaxID=2991709 RepID=A0ABT3IR19_9BACT|nr:sigma-70 family RNA polymerase sigma factor [Chitinophaga nivalis]MCW3463906.1 sigma-70 family RNA polymerase sigma factor [Chitinophaga nivalis]MCW3486404.1 sigma-70 family RNA polymerase sigma factor [Chitinophaga nivalis]
MNSNESILWDNFRNGEADALLTIYELLYPDLLKNGLSIVADEHQVKDTINQFFLYLWDNREHLNPPQHLKAYIIVSFRRKLIYDVKQHRKMSLLTIDENWAEQSQEDNIIADQTYLELQLRVRKAIEKLPRRHRELIMLKYYEGLSYEEIAERTSLSMRTIYNKLHEAIKLLKGEVFWLILLYINR